MALLLFTASEAARLLGVNRTTVSQWAARGWTTPDRTRRSLTIIDRRGRYGAARFDWNELVVADQHTRAQRRHSHRRPRPTVLS